MSSEACDSRTAPRSPRDLPQISSTALDHISTLTALLLCERIESRDRDRHDLMSVMRGFRSKVLPVLCKPMALYASFKGYEGEYRLSLVVKRPDRVAAPLVENHRGMKQESFLDGHVITISLRSGGKFDQVGAHLFELSINDRYVGAARLDVELG